MSLTEVSEALFKFRGDTSDLKAAIKDLQGVEKEHAEAQLAHTEAQEKNLEKQKKAWDGLASNLMAVKMVAHEAFEAIEAYGHKLDLEATAAGVSIEGLAKAAGGLKTNMELLEHAARLNKSAFKLTQEQMETVERAMHALEERGLSSTEVWGAFDTALSKGTTRSLEQFGIIIDKSGLQMDENGLKMDTFGQRAEAVKRIFDGVNKSLGEEMRTASLDAADQVTALQVKFKNFWEDMRTGLAKLALEFTPVLEQLARALQLLGQIGDVKIGDSDSTIGDVSSFFRHRGGLNPVTAIPDNISGFSGWLKDKSGNPEMIEALRRAMKGGGPIDPDVAAFMQGRGGVTPETLAQFMKLSFMGGRGAGTDYLSPEMQALVGDRRADQFVRGASRGPMQGPSTEPARDLDSALITWFNLVSGKLEGDKWAPKAATGAGPYTGTLADLGINVEGLDYGIGVGDLQGAGRRIRGSLGGRAGRTGYSAGELSDQYTLGTSAGDYAGFGKYDEREFQKMIDAHKVRDIEGEYSKFRGGENASFLEKTFGKPDEFNVYQSLFSGLSDAVGGTYEAIITGSEPAGQAFKKLIGSAVMATGKGELIEGMKEAAWAIGRLAIGDFAGAALHGQSAAEHFAVSALAGVIAAELGAGGSSHKPTGAGARPTAPSGGSGGSSGGDRNGNGPIIIYGDDFTESSARMRQQKAKKLVDLALGTSSTRDR